MVPARKGLVRRLPLVGSVAGTSPVMGGDRDALSTSSFAERKDRRKATWKGLRDTFAHGLSPQRCYLSGVTPMVSSPLRISDAPQGAGHAEMSPNKLYSHPSSKV